VKVKELLDVIEQFRPVLIPILGDVMLDRYVFGEVERISPEAPVPVVKKVREENRLGGAGNVAQNITQMGGQARLFSVLGQDEPGQQVEALCAKANVCTAFVFSRHRPTTLKQRILAQNQQVLRIDEEITAYLLPEEICLLRTKWENQREEFVILSDYGKGCICPQVLEMTANKKRIVDPKEKNYDLYQDFFLLTPNKKEAEQAAGLKITDQKSLLKAGEKIITRFNLKNLIITLGPEGMIIFQEDGKVYLLPTFAQKVFDVTGAGDTVIAALALGLANGLELVQAAIIANVAAGLVVAKLGTASTTLEEVKQQLQKIEHIPLKQL